MKPRRSIRYFATAALIIAGVNGAGLNATTTPAASAISAKDKADGAKANPQLIAEYGGAITGPQAAYVATIGKKIAVQSGLSNSANDFTVTLLDSSINNAFAIPGGYIYTTRQLVALMNNEAELAGVLGHETAHVALRHSAQRQSAATKNQILGVLGSILSGVVFGGNSQIGQVLQNTFLQGSQLLTLKFSRGQESQADEYGIRYLRSAGYDPRAMSTVLQSLANQNALDAKLLGSSDQVPEWASTHPDPAARVRAAASLAGNSTGVTNRDIFLSRITGMVYGDSPQQGFTEGRSFKHPIERIAFDAPQGYYLVNGTQAVAISAGGSGGGKGQFTAAQFNGNLETYVAQQFQTIGQANQVQLNPSAIQRTTVNGIPAAYSIARVTSGSTQVDVTIFAYQVSSTQAYHFQTITPAGQNPFNSMFGSMRRLSASEAASLKPRKLLVTTVRPTDTVQSLAARMAYTDAPLERFLILNGLTTSSRLTAGQKVKLVTY